MITHLTFHKTIFETIPHNNQIWLSAKQLAHALSYKNTKSLTNLFNENACEFTSSMSLVIESVTNGINGSKRRMKVRIFSLRGAHLIAMFARTPVAKEFRRWVLDILDNEVETPSRKAKADTSTDDRTPLRDAVNLLVGKKGIMYPEAYNYIHQRFGISHIDELPKRQIPQAIEYLHRLALDCEQPPKQQNQSSIIAVKKGRVLTEYRDGLIIDQKILKDEIIVGPMSVFEWIQRKAGFVPVRKEFIESIQGAFNGILPSNA
ncbi:BRO-N domain-containing protein [Salmonella enterica subsp. enterica]